MPVLLFFLSVSVADFKIDMVWVKLDFEVSFYFRQAAISDISHCYRATLVLLPGGSVSKTIEMSC